MIVCQKQAKMEKNQQYNAAYIYCIRIIEKPLYTYDVGIHKYSYLEYLYKYSHLEYYNV